MLFVVNRTSGGGSVATELDLTGENVRSGAWAQKEKYKIGGITANL